MEAWQSSCGLRKPHLCLAAGPLCAFLQESPAVPESPASCLGPQGAMEPQRRCDPRLRRSGGGMETVWEWCWYSQSGSQPDGEGNPPAVTGSAGLSAPECLVPTLPVLRRTRWLLGGQAVNVITPLERNCPLCRGVT